MTAWDRFVTDVRGKNILVFGLGLLGGGEGVVTTLAKAGAIVRVTDKKLRLNWPKRLPVCSRIN
jgi:UDP-N-acetylmuramoylalanine-D-glutamate ligase